MRTSSRLLLTALIAALTLAAAITTATATRLQLSNTGIRAVWPALKFGSTAGAGGLTVTCPVTLEGTFHSRTISKVSGQLIGFITRAIVGPQTRPPCEFNGLTSVVILTASLPWHIRYDSFRGRLPNITGTRLQLIGAAFRVSVGALNCLYKSTAAKPAFGIAVWNETTGASTGLTAESEAGSEIPIFEGPTGFLQCPTNGFFAGTSEPVTLLGTATVITIRLVQ